MKKFHTLIASDLDGTLLTQPRMPLPPELFSLIHQLSEKGFLFCVASGRSYESLLELFEPAVEKIAFVVENGARAYAQGEMLYRVSMPEPLCWELIADIHAQPDCEVRINIADKVYRVAKDDLIADFLNLPGVQAMIPVSSWSGLCGPVTKVSAFSPTGIQRAASVLIPKWQDQINADMTGIRWLDFSAVNKGFGLQKICKHYKIPLKSSIAFGDSFNDISMLEFAGCAYIMETSCSKLRGMFPQHCASVIAQLRQINETAGGVCG